MAQEDFKKVFLPWKKNLIEDFKKVYNEEATRIDSTVLTTKRDLGAFVELAGTCVLDEAEKSDIVREVHGIFNEFNALRVNLNTHPYTASEIET